MGLRRALYRDDAGTVSDLDGNEIFGLPDPSGEPDGQWLRTASGVAVWVAATAADIPFVPAGTISATDVQSAIEEVAAEAGGGGAVSSVFTRTGAVVATTGDYAADQIDFTPAGTISATDVQAAIEEVASEATGGDVAGDTHAASSKTTPVDNDEIPLVDSAASNVLKKLLWSNLKATLKTYFDTLYASSSGSAPIGTPELIYRYKVTGTDKASIDTGSDTPDAGSNDWSGGDVLEIWMVLRTDEAGAAALFDMFFNGDTSSIYDTAQVGAANTTVNGSTQLAHSGAGIGYVHGSGGSASYPAVQRLTIPAYRETGFWKVGEHTTMSVDATASANRVYAQVIGFRDTTALSRFKVAAQGTAKLKVNSWIAIYKRRSA